MSTTISNLTSEIKTHQIALLIILFIYLNCLCMGFGPTEKKDNKLTISPEDGKSFAIKPVANGIPDKARESAWKEFTQKYGDSWNVRWNPQSGTPLRISGYKISTGLAKESSDKSIEEWARNFVNQNGALLGIDANDLKLLKLTRADGKLYISFQQTYDNLAVYDSILKMNINQQGELVMLGANCFPDIAYNKEVKLTPEEAAKIAAERIISKAEKNGSSKYILIESEKVIFPMPASFTEPFHLCYLLKIHIDNPLGDWIVVIDVVSGGEYVRYNNYRFGTVSGKVTGDILPSYYNDTPQTLNFKNENIHAFTPTPVYTFDMSANPGWTTTGSWAYGVPNGVGGDVGDLAPTSGHTGTNVYGYNLTGGYENSIGSPYYLTTTAINCSGLTGTHLSFWYWLGVEYYDTATVEVSNNGTAWTVLWRNFLSLSIYNTGWRRAVYDISSIADGHSTVYVRWGMGPTDSSYTYCGWYVDDVEIYANGGTNTTNSTGDYSIPYSGSGNTSVYAELSGPYQDVYYDDGKRLSYLNTVPVGTNNIYWDIPNLTMMQSWNLSSNPGWTTEGQWAYGVPLGNAGDPTSGHTGTNVYGYNLSGAYKDDIATPYYLKTTAIDCSTYIGTNLRFWRWLGVEYWDYATIEVSNDNTNWALVYINMGFPGDFDTEWKQVTYDISSIADGKSTVYIRWAMGPTDFSINYCGWNIDDIEILSDTSGSAVKPGVYDYDEVNVFYHMGIARDSIKGIESAFVGMDYKVPAIVRIGIQYANAFWDGEGLNFGEGDGVTLRNLALFSDVIYHEFNHGITHQIYPYPMLPYTGESGAMDEGWSDYFACNITNEPLIGEGDLVIGQPFMRNLDNTLKVPDDWAGEVHDDGRIIGGAMWDLRVALGSTTASHILHFARYSLAETFFDYYEDVLQEDDDNGNLNDGTPNMAAIAQAFGNHGIGGIQVTNIQGIATTVVYNNGKLDAGETGNLIFTVQSYFLANNIQGTLATTSSYVTINDNTSNFGSLGYSATGDNSSNPFNITISPSCPYEEILDFTLALTADGGFTQSRSFSIINAPDQILYDDGAVSGGYLGYDDYGSGGGFAVRFTPPFYPINISAIRIWPSTYNVGTQITLHAWDDDGAGGSPGTDLITPKSVTVAGSNNWEEFSLATTIMQVVYEWNLDTNPGWTTQGQWAFGTPTGGGGSYGYPDPTSGATGTNVYGYNLSGDYPNNMSSTEYLTTTAIDCSTLSSVFLRFKRWLGVEQATYDHAYIKVSNNGSDWTTIWENTATISDSGWTEVSYDISSVADGQSTVYIRWGMGPTDSSWTYCGWNIDDIQILKTTGTSEGITVNSGDIYLGWIEGSAIYYNGFTTKNIDQRSWVYDIMGYIAPAGWARLDLYGWPIDMLIRARYTYGGSTDANNWTLY